MKRNILIVFALVFALQLAVPWSMIRGREKVLRHGELYLFQTQPIDPADPFQGRYVQLRFEQDYVPTEKEVDLPYRAPVHATITTGPDGFAHFTGWSREKPEHGHYLTTRSLGARVNWDRETRTSTHVGMRLDLPFDRFYMEEKKAPRAERLVRDGIRNSNCWAAVRILNGQSVLEDVFVEGRSLRELAAQPPQPGSERTQP